jgi:hypothetical protein
LFPVKALSKVFRVKYVAQIRQRTVLNKDLGEILFKKKWIVYAKRPFGNPKSVIEYLGRYTHKVAISNHRIKQVDDENVTFSYKDYRQKGLKKSMTLSNSEFIIGPPMLAFFATYFTQAICSDTSLWCTIKHMEAREVQENMGAF